MNKPLKYLAIASGSLLALLLGAAGIVAATFNPNDYKPLIIRQVQEKMQRTLVIPGEIKLSFFPKLGVDLGTLSLSEHKSDAIFASVDRARVSLALMPLLSKQLVVDQVRIDGMRLNIRRFKDGSTNFDDLLANKDEGGQQFRFDIDSVHVSNAQLQVDDRREGRNLILDQLKLDTGRLADGVPSKLELGAKIQLDKPMVDAMLALDSGFTLDLARKQYTFKGLDAKLNGTVADLRDLALKLSGNADLRPDSKRFVLDDIKFSASAKRAGQPQDFKLDIPKLAITEQRVEGGKLAGEARLAQGARNIAINIALPAFEGSPQAFKVPALTLDMAMRDAKLDVKAKASGALSGDIDKLLFASPQLALTLSGKQDGQAMNGSFTTPVTIDLAKRLVDLPKIAAQFTLPNPGGGTLALKAGGSAGINLAKEALNAQLKGSLDDSGFDAKLGMTRFSPAAYTFDIAIDKLDLDRYQAKPSVAAQKSPSADKPIDMSALKDLQAHGVLKVGALKMQNIRTTNMRLELHAADGRVDVNPLAADLYGGHAAGLVSLTVSNPMRFAVRQKLVGINLGPLLKDATGNDRIEGKGNVQMDVSAMGSNFVQMKKTLAGTARLELRDGAVKGVNIAQAVREAKTRIGVLRGDAPPQNGTASAMEKTDFSELSGSFRITAGVAHNDDLALKSPLLRVTGAGDINLGAERLDYLVRATVVSTLQGQGGPELQALKGLTVPVKLAGPFNAVGWRIDFAGMAGELAKQKLDEKKEEIRSRAQQAIDEQKNRVREQLQEGLKGLLGK